MSKTVQTNKNADKGVKIPSRGLVGWRILGPLLGLILRKLNVQFTVENMDVSETVNGLRIKGTAGTGGDTELHPFYVTISGTSILVEPGTINGIYPTIGGITINTIPAPTGTLTGIGTEYVWIKTTVALSSAYSYVYSASLSSALISGGSSVPPDSLAGGEYYVTLASFQDGVKTSQPIRTSLTAHWCDDGTATSQATQGTTTT